MSTPTPWRAPLEPWLLRLGWQPGCALPIERLNAIATERMCVSGGGVPVRFADASELPDDARPYEQRIHEAGVIATRMSGPGALHDAFNALAWLAFPKMKACLNRLHARVLHRSYATGPRGTLRDRATLFDESGAIVLTRDAALEAALRDFDWQRLFVVERHRFSTQARLVVVGHAVQEKLSAPYKAICAQVWVLALSPDCPDDEVDGLAAQQLDAAVLDALTPLPVLGVPGWWAANDSPEFYNDPQVFRRRRSR